jgi:hypothetical protein
VRNGHFIWLFHLVESPDDANLLSFAEDSAIYNVNTMRSIFDSMVVRPVPMAQLMSFASGVVRAVVLALHVTAIDVHLDCGCAIRKGICPRCSVDYGARHRRELALTCLLDDGSCEPVVVHGLASACDFFVNDVSDWQQLNQMQGNMIGSVIGREFVFFLSRCRPADFGFDEDEGELWRIDAVSPGSEETNRTGRTLVELLKSDSEYQIGYTSASFFHNVAPGGSEFL